MKVRFAILILISFLFFSKESYSQLFPRFSIAGGPTIGWQYQNTDDLNNEMKKIGIPTFPVDGFMTLGGGGFVDLPFKSLNWLRVGGSGTGSVPPLTFFIVCAADRHMSLSYKEDDPGRVFNLTLF